MGKEFFFKGNVLWQFFLVTNGPGVCPRVAASSCRSGQECGDTLMFTLRSQVCGEPGVMLVTAETTRRNKVRSPVSETSRLVTYSTIIPKRTHRGNSW